MTYPVTETAFDHLGKLISGAIFLKSEVFFSIQQLPLGLKAAIRIVLLTGLSQAIGQGIVLFANRVKPFRFILSLILSAILYTISFLFWVLTTWLVSSFLFEVNTSFNDVVRTLGLSYAPLLGSFLIALPYFGVPISVILSIWSFLSFLVGLSVVFQLDTWESFQCAILGWLVFQFLQRTIGKPLASTGKWLKNSVSGVKLITDLKELETILKSGDKSP